MFPFSEAKKVLLISFISTDGSNILVLDDDTRIPLDTTNIDKYEVKYLKSFTFYQNKAIKKYFAQEIVEIDKNQIDILSNLMFNYKIKKLPKLTVESPMGCYIPRNAILFLDGNDNVISNLEICFECLQAYLFPDPYNTNELANKESCYGRIDLLKAFFDKNGIKLGIEKL
ncbi:hypothetical protein J2X31_001532 [Flavobacterium arsenatis]|uniref:Uncharacterized protein n=1 Tax=Flavobacterium arsenatis TaxID=1484332 RepID=A0ABU1TNJ4_9FLAO|nr:hypothetical protein [Flavobacterium arsenatis]MDR6967521.1 hypothetical protein [Flavobacterium arsenatis]